MNISNKAKSFGASETGFSKVKGYVIYEKINFGSNVGSTFIDHNDNKKRKAWRARHSKIKNKEGQFVYKLKTSPSFWSYNLLW